jgi:choice-of-anchor B domain-containing protein
MRKSTFCLFLFAFIALAGKSQTLSLVGELRFPEFYAGSGDSTGGSDCWGWRAPDGTEYAIMGTRYGTHYVRVPDLTLIDSVFGAQNNDVWYHRDIKTWRNYAFIVGEMRGPECGVQVVDLSYLPDSVHHVTTYKTAFDSTAHNLSIDTVNALAYILKSNYSGCRIVDISNPANLVDVGVIITDDIHDVYARNDTAWIAEGNDRVFSVWNCADPSNPIAMGAIADNNFGYCHNIWAREDGKYFATAEETAGKTVKIWDMTDVTNITFVSEFIAPCSLVHNVHWMGDYIYCSHYESGVVIANVTDPANPFIAASHDNYTPSESGNFNGCWGAFPFTNGGYVYGSTIEGFLTVLQFDQTIGRETGQQPELFGLAFPNPANDRISVPFSLEKITQVRVSLYDGLGREVKLLANDTYDAGTHQWEATVTDLAPGIYTIRILAGEAATTTTVAITH